MTLQEKFSNSLKFEMQNGSNGHLLNTMRYNPTAIIVEPATFHTELDRILASEK